MQETRRWDDNKDRTSAMRSKENAQDYRYFPEPDLAPIEISEDWLESVRASLPEMAREKKARYQAEFGLPEYDAGILTGTKALADLFERASALCGRAKDVSNWILGDVLKAVKDAAIEPKDMALTPENLAAVMEELGF